MNIAPYRRPLRALVLLLFAASGPAAGQDHAAPKRRTSPTYLSASEARAADLYRNLLPTVVTIFTRGSVPTQRGPRAEEGLGSGVLISPDCHVLTAAHVVSGADEIVVRTHDGELRPARLLLSEATADIALLQLVEPAQTLAHAPLGDSDQLVVGQETFVIGSPYGLDESFSMGHVSGFRELGLLYDGTILAELIQTDAAINSGNSGGPVFNSNGEVIGIASSIVTVSGGFQGLGFVVAINTAKQVLAFEGRTWMGFEAIYLDRETLGALFHLDLDGALLVQSVVPDSPAARAGLQGGSIPADIAGQQILLGGDLILELDTQEACHAECLVRAHPQLSSLDHRTLRLLRNGRQLEIEVDTTGSRRNYLVAAPSGS